MSVLTATGHTPEQLMGQMIYCLLFISLYFLGVFAAEKGKALGGAKPGDRFLCSVLFGFSATDACLTTYRSYIRVKLSITAVKEWAVST